MIPVIGEHIRQTFAVNTARSFGKRGNDSESLLEVQEFGDLLEKKSLQFNGQSSKWNDGFLGEDGYLFTILTSDLEESLQEPRGRSYLLISQWDLGIIVPRYSSSPSRLPCSAENVKAVTRGKSSPWLIRSCFGSFMAPRSNQFESIGYRWTILKVS